MPENFDVQLILSSVGGIAISLLFSYVPGFKDWYEKKTSQQKQLLMLLFMVLAVLFMFLLSWLGIANIFTLDKNGIWEALVALYLVAVANTATYKATSYIGK